MSKKDKLFQQKRTKPEPFVFDEAVAQVFPDMVKRSVPGYSNVIAGTGLIASEYAQAGSNIYDLGCSVGASTFAVLQHINTDDFHLIAVDNSPHMITLCQQNIKVDHNANNVEYRCDDIQDIEINNASVVILNYTLQFIPLDERVKLLTNIYQGMNDGAVLVLSEKLAFDTDAEHQRQTALHNSFKRAQGYSDLEISQKRAALEDVLVPESLSTHIDRLNQIGLRDTQLWFRSINFASILAWEIVDFEHLRDLLKAHDLWEWGHDLEDICRKFLKDNPHGRTPIWLETISSFPDIEISHRDLNTNAVTVSTTQEVDIDFIRAQLLSMFPWRKGPFHIHGIDIDTEWRSDLKWDRVYPEITSLTGRNVLDIGCGNGYHMWRMLGAGARCVIGVDPMRLFVAQFKAIRHFVGKELPVSLLPISIEDLPLNQTVFDTIFSMGVLYHRRDPVTHIHQLKSLLKPGGELVLETLIIEKDGNTELIPEGRYASMRNVYSIPSIQKLTQWMEEAGMYNIKIVDVSPTTVDEQRTTEWMPYHSLTNFLDPDDMSKTIEGHPAPVRAVAIASV